MPATSSLPDGSVSGTTITVRYWAAARAAAATASEEVAALAPLSLAEVTETVLARRDGDARRHLQKVLGACSVLVGERPVGTRDPAEVAVPPGAGVEFLPPFAGG